MKAKRIGVTRVVSAVGAVASSLCPDVGDRAGELGRQRERQKMNRRHAFVVRVAMCSLAMAPVLLAAGCDRTAGPRRQLRDERESWAAHLQVLRNRQVQLEEIL